MTKRNPSPKDQYGGIRPEIVALYWTVVFALVFAFVIWLAGCGPIIRYPSCGTWQPPRLDGAVCRECLDRDGSRYGECGSSAYQPH